MLNFGCCAPVKRWAGNVVSNMTHSVGLNSTQLSVNVCIHTGQRWTVWWQSNRWREWTTAMSERRQRSDSSWRGRQRCRRRQRMFLRVMRSNTISQWHQLLNSFNWLGTCQSQAQTNSSILGI